MDVGSDTIIPAAVLVVGGLITLLLLRSALRNLKNIWPELSLMVRSSTGPVMLLSAYIMHSKARSPFKYATQRILFTVILVVIVLNLTIWVAEHPRDVFPVLFSG